MWLYILTPGSDRFFIGATEYLYMTKRYIEGKGLTNTKRLSDGVRFYFDPHKTQVTVVDDYTNVRRTPGIVCRDTFRWRNL